MAQYEFNAYDTQRDDWDSLESIQEIAQAIRADDVEVWLYRYTERDGLTDKAEVKQGKLPVLMQWEGYKVPKRFHKMLDKIGELQK